MPDQARAYSDRGLRSAGAARRMFAVRIASARSLRAGGESELRAFRHPSVAAACAHAARHACAPAHKHCGGRGNAVAWAGASARISLPLLAPFCRSAPRADARTLSRSPCVAPLSSVHHTCTAPRNTLQPCLPVDHEWRCRGRPVAASGAGLIATCPPGVQPAIVAYASAAQDRVSTRLRQNRGGARVRSQATASPRLASWPEPWAGRDRARAVSAREAAGALCSPYDG